MVACSFEFHRVLIRRAWIYLIFYQLFVLTFSASAQLSRIRQPVDTIGFATRDFQMDSLIARTIRNQDSLIRKALSDAGMNRRDKWKVIISPHDDYTYVGYLYPALFQNLTAKTIFLFGVAHKARQLNMENRLVFDSYPAWKTPRGKIPVSAVREEVMKLLPSGSFMISDSLHKIEHSLEALMPFIQFYRPDAEIIPILVPATFFSRTHELSRQLASAIYTLADERNWKWGADYALVISSDAVHYGDEGWGGSNYAFCGADSAGYQKAIAHEGEIMHTLSGKLKPENVRQFTSLTLDDRDFRIYKWTWCGRYSIPMGLLTSYYLSKFLQREPPEGIPLGYSTSIASEPIPVKDIGMGVTAQANIRHWVGYPAIGYK